MLVTRGDICLQQNQNRHKNPKDNRPRSGFPTHFFLHACAIRRPSSRVRNRLRGPRPPSQQDDKRQHRKAFDDDDYHECTKRASEELKNNARPQILDPLDSIEEYDTIYLGYPNWWSTMPTIVMNFLESYDFTNKHIYPICSHEGSGMGRSESDLKKLCPNSILHKGLSIHGSHVDGCRQQLERGLGEK